MCAAPPRAERLCAWLEQSLAGFHCFSEFANSCRQNANCSDAIVDQIPANSLAKRAVSVAAPQRSDCRKRDHRAPRRNKRNVINARVITFTSLKMPAKIVKESENLLPTLVIGCRTEWKVFARDENWPERGKNYFLRIDSAAAARG